MSTPIDIVGYIGSFTLSVTYIPQIISIYKTRSTKDLSYIMVIMLIIGYIIFLVYGVLIKSIPLIASISISLTNCVHLVVLKLFASCGVFKPKETSITPPENTPEPIRKHHHHHHRHHHKHHEDTAKTQEVVIDMSNV
jgi:MtN3 and saliva related transmembrane protein